MTCFVFAFRSLYHYLIICVTPLFIFLFWRVSVMSAGFGWPLSDVHLFAQYAGRIHKALKDEGGSASDYQQATKILLSLQFTLEQIQIQAFVTPFKVSWKVLRTLLLVSTRSFKINMETNWESPPSRVDHMVPVKRLGGHSLLQKRFENSGWVFRNSSR